MFREDKIGMSDNMTSDLNSPSEFKHSSTCLLGSFASSSSAQALRRDKLRENNLPCSSLFFLRGETSYLSLSL